MADQILQDIKDRLDIAEVIGGYIQIKKAGVNFKAVCPFHNEKSASLVISPQKQIWHCFGCGEGGDVFGFVMRYENLEFREALKLLAQRAGVQLPEYQPQPKEKADEQEQLLRINDFAARFYHELFLKDKRAEPARKYLQKRGLSNQTIQQWKIGFAPNEFHALEQALAKKQVSTGLMVKAGVSAKNERGQIYDRFRGRITFPIFNTVGDVVGFSARILPELDDGKGTHSTHSAAFRVASSGTEMATSSGQAKFEPAKYINSPETVIYNKSKVLFGFNFAKAGIRQRDEVIVVEGQMDCISAHQAGFANVVASSGTALAFEQLTQVGRFSRNLKFCFDADNAGLLATLRAVENSLGKGFTVKTILLPGAKDPDELIRKDPKAFARAVEQAPLFLDFYIGKQFEQYQNNFEEKKRAESQLIPLLALLTDPLEVDHYIKAVAERMEVTPHVLMEALNSFKAKKPKGYGQKSEPEAVKPAVQNVNGLEKQVLGGMLLYPDFKALVKQAGSEDDFTHPEAKLLAHAILSGQAVVPETLLAKESIFMVESGLAETDGGDTALHYELKKAFAMLRLNAIKEQLTTLNARVKLAEEQKQKETVTELSRQFAALSKQRLDFEKML